MDFILRLHRLLSFPMTGLCHDGASALTAAVPFGISTRFPCSSPVFVRSHDVPLFFFTTEYCFCGISSVKRIVSLILLMKYIEKTCREYNKKCHNGHIGVEIFALAVIVTKKRIIFLI
jgi:hypothetical protein